MKRSLTAKETVTITSMLFGMFFGAGNLIFPAKMGVDAGSNLLSGFLGVFVTAVGIPMLAVVALGLSRCEGVVPLANKVGKKYSIFFCSLLYLTIGPLFAIPRCASTSFSVGAVGLLGSEHSGLYLAIFSFVFFAIVLLFSLKPSGIMTWIGKILNPVFLVFLFALVIAAMVHPIDQVALVTPAEGYATGGQAFFTGFLEGYNTLDALAGLAFGIVVINVVRSTGIRQPEDVAKNTAKAGIFSCLFMGVIYFFITLICTQSASLCANCTNGGEVLGTIATYYFHSVGSYLTAAIVTFACLKTAIGLVTSCSEAFVQMFPKGPKYPAWAVIFCIAAFGIANFGLSTIVAWCVPVLMFVYPLAITLILLALTEKWFGGSKQVYVCTTAFTLVAASFDLLGTLAGLVPQSSILAAVKTIGTQYIPLYSLGMGWIVPALIGFAVGMILRSARNAKEIVLA